MKLVYIIVLQQQDMGFYYLSAILLTSFVPITGTLFCCFIIFFFDCDTFSLENTCIWHMHSSIRYKSKTLISFGLWKLRHGLISVAPFRMWPQLFGQSVEFVLVSIIFLILIFFVLNIYYIPKRWGYYIQYCEFDIIEANYLNFCNILKITFIMKNKWDFKN